MTHTASTTRLVVPVSPADHALGLETEPVTLVEYGDYQCPACGQAYPMIKDLLARVGGRVRFVFRNFPLATIHPHAERAAEAAEAAGSQGRFWPMHDTLFENQGALGDGDLVGYASALGLDGARFVTELAERVHADRVRGDFMGGVRSGVNGTPTFFINGVRYDGSLSAKGLLEAIEAAIAVTRGQAGFEHSSHSRSV